MTLRSMIASSLLCTLAFGLPTHAAAQKTPEKIRLTAASKDGAVLMRVARIPADFQLFLQKSGSSGFGSRVYMMDVKPGRSGETYIARTLPPGRYRIDSIWQQKRWGLLLSGDTVEFDIRPGRISYLGALNSSALLEAIQTGASAAGKTVSLAPGSGYSSREHGLVPTFGGRDTASFGEALAFSQTMMLASPDTVDLAPLHPSSDRPAGTK
jgi:hypothetical protein